MATSSKLCNIHEHLKAALLLVEDFLLEDVRAMREEEETNLEVLFQGKGSAGAGQLMKKTGGRG